MDKFDDIIDFPIFVVLVLDLLVRIWYVLYCFIVIDIDFGVGFV